MHESQRQPARWERQPGETSRQFAKFRVYRDMHTLDRSLAELGRKLGTSTTMYVERLSAKFQWVTLLQRLGISIRSVNEPLTDHPVGNLTGNLLAAVAQFDNDEKVKGRRPE